MKKKYIISFLFILLLFNIVLLPNVYALTRDTNLVYVTIPDSFKRYVDDTKSAGYNYELYENSNRSLGFIVKKITNGKYSYTNDDLNKRVNSVKNSASSTNKISMIESKFLTLNYTNGMKISYSQTENKKTTYRDVYYFLSDHYEIQLLYQSIGTNNLNSDEEKTFIHSFKVHDSVTRTGVIPFWDIGPADWYFECAKYAYKNNIISGYENKAFGPNDNLTRGMLVTILYRMEGSPNVTNSTNFNDVKDSTKYYYKAVNWANKNGVVYGYNSNQFGPEDNITREQLAVMLNRYAKYKNKLGSTNADLNKFKDSNKISDFAIQSMKWAISSGIIKGNADGTLKPVDNATRAEAAAMLQRYWENLK